MEACDIQTPDGLRVEVKASGYLQTWKQTRLSKPIFGIRATRGWDAVTNVMADVAARNADVFVFALHAHQDRDTVDPLDLNQWEFYIVAAPVLDVACPKAKTISLAGLHRISVAPVRYESLSAAVRAADPRTTP